MENTPLIYRECESGLEYTRLEEKSDHKKQIPDIDGWTLSQDENRHPEYLNHELDLDA